MLHGAPVQANAAMRKERRQRLKQRGRSKPHKLVARKQELRATAAKVNCDIPHDTLVEVICSADEEGERKDCLCTSSSEGDRETC